MIKAEVKPEVKGDVKPVVSAGGTIMLAPAPAPTAAPAKPPIDPATVAGKSVCPMCREFFSPGQVLTLDQAQMIKRQEELQRAANEQKALGRTELSSKIRALFSEFDAAARADSTWKAVVFSQWTQMLDRVGDALRDRHVAYVRLDGSMAAAARRKAITSFREDPKVQVFLISLKAGGLGLNLTAANKVVLLDPWWNPAQEDQAVDRIHRLGQKRNVEIIRMLVRGSVEERIMELQSKKREMMNAALQSSGTARQNREKIKEERLSELSILFK